MLICGLYGYYILDISVGYMMVMSEFYDSSHCSVYNDQSAENKPS